MCIESNTNTNGESFTGVNVNMNVRMKHPATCNPDSSLGLEADVDSNSTFSEPFETFVRYTVENGKKIKVNNVDGELNGKTKRRRIKTKPGFVTVCPFHPVLKLHNLKCDASNVNDPNLNLNRSSADKHKHNGNNVENDEHSFDLGLASSSSFAVSCIRGVKMGLRIVIYHENSNSTFSEEKKQQKVKKQTEATVMETTKRKLKRKTMELSSPSAKCSYRRNSRIRVPATTKSTVSMGISVRTSAIDLKKLNLTADDHDHEDNRLKTILENRKDNKNAKGKTIVRMVFSDANTYSLARVVFTLMSLKEQVSFSSICFVINCCVTGGKENASSSVNFGNDHTFFRRHRPDLLRFFPNAFIPVYPAQNDDDHTETSAVDLSSVKNEVPGSSKCVVYDYEGCSINDSSSFSDSGSVDGNKVLSDDSIIPLVNSCAKPVRKLSKVHVLVQRGSLCNSSVTIIESKPHGTKGQNTHFGDKYLMEEGKFSNQRMEIEAGSNQTDLKHLRCFLDKSRRRKEVLIPNQLNYGYPKLNEHIEHRAA
eukprot:CAMPEP_0204892492 /NCGR_PEP_ID=MMETSP1349-20130617/29284_1 /ASSEMBLY_ACC=CAM_ASM_000710 /TAXON_ID=215587 /ORGANISM="Aplanochytrium stocchinoi, Strain GSBS06" /LENGTH=536 /DNA_ID=CAMNT_0052058441 /DNA_START=188 /DNA_END=1798 /DNA_ORIENTATION=+